MSSAHTRYEPGPPPPGWNPPSHGPPPIPPGMNVNPQLWGRGAWQFNPAYNNAGRPPHQATVPWVAGFGWYGWQGTSHANVQATGQSAAAAAAAASHNPYKRIPRPPSAEYLATKLVDNPLGLTNMIPRDELRGQDGYPQSPWIWNPPGLISDESDDGVITADFRDAQGRRVAQEVRGPTPSRQGSQDRDMDGSSHHEVTPPARRGSTNRVNDLSPMHQNHRNNDSPRSQNSRDSTPSRRNSNDSMSQSTRSSLPSSDRPLGRPKDPSSAYQQRFNSPNASDASTRDSPSLSSFLSSGASSDRTASTSIQNELTVQESFTSKGELHPTFSTNIVRTPDYYQSVSRRNSHDEEAANRNPSSSMSNLTSRMERLGTSHTIQNSIALTRHSSMPSSAFSTSSSSAVISHPSDFVDEPTTILSPLVMTATPKVSSRPVTRGMSVPDIRGGSGLSAIPEVSPTSRGLSLPPNSTHISSVTPNRDGHTTPPSTHSHNPLPRPPYEVHHPAAAASPMRIPTPPPGSYSSRVRLGFWNRRGDHLTRTMHVVYAPPEKAYPRELQGYPAETEGFRDHLGTFVPYNPDRPELPESLPRHGKPPMQPYSIFVVYEYRR